MMIVMMMMMMMMMYNEVVLKNNALKISILFIISSHIFVDMNFLTGSLYSWVLICDSD
jgi:hypothetical protein